MTKQEILSRLLSNISDEYDKTVGSFFYDAEAPVAVEIEEVHAELSKILKNALAKTAGGVFLDDKVAEQGLTRKPATFAVGEVEITGDNGTIIPVGVKVASDNVIFSTTDEAIIENGAAIAPVQSNTAGRGGNLPIGAISRFPVTLAGLVSVTNPAPTGGGYDAESDAELRARYFEKVSAPVTSGNANHYKLWAKEVAGVGDAKVIETWAGGGTVKVIIVDAERGVAGAELVQQAREHIESVRPVGAVVTVVSAIPRVIDISVKIDGTGEGIAEAINNYLKKIAFTGRAVSLAHVGAYILSCEDVRDYEDLKLNGRAENIPINQDEVAVMGNLQML